MVLLTVTPAAQAAIQEYDRLKETPGANETIGRTARISELSNAELGSPVEHGDLIEISKYLVAKAKRDGKNSHEKEWRLDTLLKGAIVYQPPPPPKPEPTEKYKVLMKRLRAEEEQRQYDHMVNLPPAQDTFNQRFPNSAYSFNPATSIGQSAAAEEIDEVTFADVNRQVTLIINVLVSIIACGITIWVAARRWEAPQRLGLSMSGSGLVAVAEVAIYMGYIRRIKDAKTKESKVVEVKEIVDTWVLDGSKENESTTDAVRFRKGKHR